MEQLVSCIEKLFIYHNKEFNYHIKFSDKYRKDLTGSFWRHNLI